MLLSMADTDVRGWGLGRNFHWPLQVRGQRQGQVRVSVLDSIWPIRWDHGQM